MFRRVYTLTDSFTRKLGRRVTFCPVTKCEKSGDDVVTEICYCSDDDIKIGFVLINLCQVYDTVVMM